MMNDSKGLRAFANGLRAAADAADKVVDLMEKEDCTEAELEEASKDFMWKIMKLEMLK